MAYVSNIQRFSVHDGPGIRTVVFFLGCPLKCKWCQNPENISSMPKLMINDQECIGCGSCIEKCPVNAITLDNTLKVYTNLEKCIKCWNCVEECVTDARKIVGRDYTVDLLFKELMNDYEFFKISGGITLSGGEPTLNSEFCLELLNKLKINQIHTAIETCGCVSWEIMERLAKYTDLFLYDIKIISSDQHKKWTGVDNKLILDNVYKLCSIGKEVIPRIPLIPGVNDTDKEFSKIISFIRKLKGVKRIDILPFHQLGSSKYKMLGLDYEMIDWPEDNSYMIKKCVEIAREFFIVSVGGS